MSFAAPDPATTTASADSTPAATGGGFGFDLAPDAATTSTDGMDHSSDDDSALDMPPPQPKLVRTKPRNVPAGPSSSRPKKSKTADPVSKSAKKRVAKPREGAAKAGTKRSSSAGSTGGDVKRRKGANGKTVERFKAPRKGDAFPAEKRKKKRADEAPVQSAKKVKARKAVAAPPPKPKKKSVQPQEAVSGKPRGEPAVKRRNWTPEEVAAREAERAKREHDYDTAVRAGNWRRERCYKVHRDSQYGIPTDFFRKKSYRWKCVRGARELAAPLPLTESGKPAIARSAEYRREHVHENTLWTACLVHKNGCDWFRDSAGDPVYRTFVVRDDTAVMLNPTNIGTVLGRGMINHVPAFQNNPERRREYYSEVYKRGNAAHVAEGLIAPIVPSAIAAQDGAALKVPPPMTPADTTTRFIAYYRRAFGNPDVTVMEFPSAVSKKVPATKPARAPVVIPTEVFAEAADSEDEGEEEDEEEQELTASECDSADDESEDDDMHDEEEEEEDEEEDADTSEGEISDGGEEEVEYESD